MAGHLLHRETEPSFGCRYLRDHLEKPYSKEAIAEVATKLKAGALDVGSDYLDGEDIG